MSENVVSYKSIQHLTERMLAVALADIAAPLQGELDLTQRPPLLVTVVLAVHISLSITRRLWR